MYRLNGAGNFAETEYCMNDEPLLAALFTTGNGYMGVRGSFEEFGSLRVQGAFVRGFIDEITEVVEPFCSNEYMRKYYLDEQKLKRFQKQDSCVNMPDFTLVRINVGGKTFYPWNGKLLHWERWLDASRAVYVRSADWEDDEGNRTRFTFTRFASFADDHLYCQKVEIRPLNHSLPVEIYSGVDTLVKTAGQHITQNDSCTIDGPDIYYAFHAVNKYKFSAEYAIFQNFPKGKLSGKDGDEKAVLCRCDPAEEYVFEKLTYISTSRDEPSPRPKLSFREAFEAHISAYADYFSPMDVRIEGDGEADGYLRFASYHTAISAPRHDCIHSAAAKGLTGERYNQFVWWDCEIYQLPFFLFTAPETAKMMLRYRERMLPAAKENARASGERGAKFAFCSSVEGDERVWIYARHPFLQIHINSDIPYGIIHYYYVTGDGSFLRESGMEIIRQCLLFWLNRAEFTGERYEIRNVTGTDEHHPYVNNDAYTNYSVHYIAAEYLKLVRELGVPADKKELEAIGKLRDLLYLPVTAEGMVPQFDGYFDLSRGLEVEGSSALAQFQMKKSGLYHKSQVIKQPDVLMLYTYLDVDMSTTDYAANSDYYQTMCEASSSLSYPPHAIACADNGQALSFYQNFLKSIKIDVDDIHGVAWQGVHSGCLAGGYLAVLRGIFGIRASENGLCFAPVRMPLWKKVTAKCRYKGTLLEAELAGTDASLRVLDGAPVRIVTPAGEVMLKKEIHCKAEERR